MPVKKFTPPDSFSVALTKQAGVALLYAALGLITHHFIVHDGLVSIVWPGSGLALAALLIGGKRYLWSILAGTLLLNLFACDFQWMALGLSAANVAEAYLGYQLLTTRHSPFDAALPTLSAYLRLLLLGGALAGLAGASIGTAALLAGDVISAANAWENWTHWWMGNVLGVTLLTPLILIWRQPRCLRCSGLHWLEIVALSTLTVLVGQIVFLDWFHDSIGSVARGYWMFLLITWIAARMGARGTTLILLVIGVQALLGALLGLGFFRTDIAQTGLHNYWFYMLTIAIVGIALSTYVGEIRQVMEALQTKDVALNATANAILITDADGQIEWANPAFSELTGFALDEVIGRNPRDLVRSGTQDSAYYQTMWATILSGQVWRGELVNCRKDGSLYHEDMTITPMTDELGGITHFVAIKQDISERKRQEKELATSEQHFRQLFERHSAVMLLLDPSNGAIVDANPAAAQFYGYPLEVLQRMSISQINTLPPLELRQKLQQTLNEESNHFIFQHRLANHDIRVVEAYASPINYREKTLLFAIIHDITKRHQAEEQIRQLAFYDALTQLPNRRLLNERLTQALLASKRNQRYGALMFLDLDNFKPLNDLHGHSVGDLLLIEVARRIKGCLREVDTVARFGGDEFVILLTELDEDRAESGRQAESIAEKIRQTLAAPYILTHAEEDGTSHTVEHRCTSSIGVALFTGQDARADDIMKWADAAMYQAKDAGRNQICFYLARST